MFSCFNENASARSWDISCGERDAGSEAKSRRRAEIRKGWLDGKCLDLVVLVRSLSLPLAKIKVIVLTTLVYDNTRRQQGHPMDLFLKISVLHANFCWLGDVEEIIVLGRKVLLGKR